LVINFENKSDLEEFPVNLYSNFLKYVTEKYKNHYWNALPRDIAKYYQENINNLDIHS